MLEPTAAEIFDGSLKSDDLITKISAYIGTRKLIPGRTLIFLDEIQECPNARTALKSFALDGRYDIIASGSLLGIKYRSKKRREKSEPKSIAVGYERQVTMHSLDFEEFLWAKGILPEVIASLKGYYERREALPDVLNERFSGYLREYMMVGGMPSVVRAYVECGNFGPVQEEQEKILDAYIDDIHKYAEKVDVPKIESCYRAIPRILAKDNRKFKYSEVEKNGSERKFGESIEWLKDAALAPLAANVVAPELPLSANVREGWFKLYLSDIGLLSALYGLETKKLLFAGRLAGAAKGGLYENFVDDVLLYGGGTLDGEDVVGGDATVGEGRAGADVVVLLHEDLLGEGHEVLLDFAELGGDDNLAVATLDVAHGDFTIDFRNDSGVAGVAGLEEFGDTGQTTGDVAGLSYSARNLDEDIAGVEKCEGSPSCCFAPFMVLKNEEDIKDWYEEGIECNINQALIRTGLVNDKEEVMIDCCW